MSRGLPADAGERVGRLMEADNAGELLPPVQLGPFCAFVLAGALRVGLNHPDGAEYLTEPMRAYLSGVIHATIEQLPPAAQAVARANPDDPEVGEREALLVAELYMAEVDGAVLPRLLYAGPFGAFVVITTLQMATTHPGFAAAPIMAEQVQRIIDTLTTGLPPYARSLVMAGNR